MSNKFEKFLPDLDKGPAITQIGTADLSISENGKHATKFLRPEVHLVDFGENEDGIRKTGVHWRIRVDPGVMGAHINENEEVTLIRNTRYPLIEIGENGEVIDDGISFELPGGGVEPSTIELLRSESRYKPLGNLAMEALKGDVIREFREEAGVEMNYDDVTYLTALNVAVGTSNQKIYGFHGTGGTATKKDLDDGELTSKTFSVPLRDALEMSDLNMIREGASKHLIEIISREYGIEMPKRLNLQKNSFPSVRQQ